MRAMGKEAQQRCDIKVLWGRRGARKTVGNLGTIQSTGYIVLQSGAGELG